jgi:hypothetical protein
MVKTSIWGWSLRNCKQRLSGALVKSDGLRSCLDLMSSLRQIMRLAIVTRSVSIWNATRPECKFFDCDAREGHGHVILSSSKKTKWLIRMFLLNDSHAEAICYTNFMAPHLQPWYSVCYPYVGHCGVRRQRPVNRSFRVRAGMGVAINDTFFFGSPR